MMNQCAVAADPLGAALLIAVPFGVLGVFVLALAERLLPVLPSYGLFTAIGVASAEGDWWFPTAVVASVLGSGMGVLGAYRIGSAAAAQGGRRLRRLLRRRDRFGRILRTARQMGAAQPFTTQLVPATRILAPLVGGAVGRDRRRYLLRALAGLTVWNVTFIALGFLIVRLGGPSNATTISITLVGTAATLALAMRLAPDSWRRFFAATISRFHRDAADRLQFLLAWIRNPQAVAAIAPSGRALAELITSEIGAGTGRVLELGSGTGAFAAALLARGVAEGDLTLVEREDGFARLLVRRYPRSTVLVSDAETIGGSENDAAARFGAVVCGLGLLNMPPEQVERILVAAFAQSRADAALYLFTYGRSCSVPAEVLARLNLDVQRIGKTCRNLPPASVYRLSRDVALARAA
jgi:phospholipid N-methyltransferase/membrane protein DedA with SNARE-associated domain